MSQDQVWEIGGEFHWPGLSTGPFIPWPQPHVWFALGRDIVLAIWRQYSSQNRSTTLLVPDYFCPEVMAYWKRAGVKIDCYADDPRWNHPDWDRLNPSQGDLVLAVNYFGVRTGSAWQAWHRAHEFVILIEDHSHDPLSHWALTSKADYAFASIRKTVPVPDGALLWSPSQHPLPPEPQSRNWSGSALKLAAMIWKSEYLVGDRGNAAIKHTFRSFQVEGEKRLTDIRVSSISPWSHALLKAGFPKRWRQQREKNVRLFLELTSGQNAIEPLFVDWPVDHCPFNAILIFSTQAHREAFRSQLVAAGIYPAIHWTAGPEASPRPLDLSNRILTIPMDQRYNFQDALYAASVLSNTGSARTGEVKS